jgi:hypothetical protein
LRLRFDQPGQGESQGQAKLSKKRLKEKMNEGRGSKRGGQLEILICGVLIKAE